MSEKANLIPTVILAATGFVSAGMLQLFLVWTLGVKVTRYQLIGMVGISAMLGGCASTLGQEWLHWNSFIAGVLGTLTGMIPAAVSSSIITRKALEKAGMSPAEMTDMLERIKNAQNEQGTGGPQ